MSSRLFMYVAEARDRCIGNNTTSFHRRWRGRISNLHKGDEKVHYFYVCTLLNSKVKCMQPSMLSNYYGYSWQKLVIFRISTVVISRFSYELISIQVGLKIWCRLRFQLHSSHLILLYLLFQFKVWIAEQWIYLWNNEYCLFYVDTLNYIYCISNFTYSNENSVYNWIIEFYNNISLAKSVKLLV